MSIVTLTREIHGRGPEYFQNGTTGKNYTHGLYKFEVYTFAKGYYFLWSFNRHNGEELARGNSLWSSGKAGLEFKSIEDIKSFIQDFKNLLKLR